MDYLQGEVYVNTYHGHFPCVSPMLIILISAHCRESVYDSFVSDTL